MTLTLADNITKSSQILLIYSLGTEMSKAISKDGNKYKTQKQARKL